MSATSEQPAIEAEREYFFGSFHFLPGRQQLLQDGVPLRLAGRALEILAVLVARPGELISKQELMARVWPAHVVEESNLKVNMANLRRALGEGGRESRYIATLVGRGYRFVAPVTSTAGTLAVTPALAIPEQLNNLPVPATRPIGRTETIAILLRTLEQHRLVSIVGAGGVGKSTVMLSVAEAYVAQSASAVCFVDLSPLSGDKFVTGTVAAALGVEIHSSDGLQALVASLRERELLLVLDNCEHVIDEVAVLVEKINAGAPGIRVLATSREPLRVAGEYLHRLVPLAFPVDTDVNAARAMQYPAVQLFAQRASESLDGYQLADADARAIAEICARLEGIPLAIELAATRLDVFGAQGLAAQLETHFKLLRSGRRTSNARHRTLEAALDWSYDYLRLDEQKLLCSLSIFAGAFTLDAAFGLAVDAATDAATVVDAIASLVDKSLLSADASGARMHYRLLETTKAYAVEKLGDRGELVVMRRRHLDFYRSIFEEASAEWEIRSGADWLAKYGRNLDDVRVALAWAYSPGGEAAAGAVLTVAAIPLWMELSLLDEARHCIERALDVPGAVPAAAEMKLRAALGAATLYAHGPLPETNAAWMRVLELADQQQDCAYQLMALWGMATYRSYLGECQTVQDLAERFGALATKNRDQAAMLDMERLIGTALHFSGQQAAAQRRLETVLNHYVSNSGRSSMARFQLDQRSAALGTLANVLWLRGYADQAVHTVQAALQAARDAGHAASLMNVIATAGFAIMIFTGDDAAAERLAQELEALLAKHALPLWQTLSGCMRATIRVRNGDAAALPLLHEAVDKLQEGEFRLRLTCHLATLAAACGAQGRRQDGLWLVGGALAYCESGEERWCHAELLRVQGELLEADDAEAALNAYTKAMAVAREQGALAWELRAAINLAQLKIRQGAPDAGREVLLPVFQKFTEGLATTDIAKARALLGPAPVN